MIGSSEEVILPLGRKKGRHDPWENSLEHSFIFGKCGGDHFSRATFDLQ